MLTSKNVQQTLDIIDKVNQSAKKECLETEPREAENPIIIVSAIEQ